MVFLQKLLLVHYVVHHYESCRHLPLVGLGCPRSCWNERKSWEVACYLPFSPLPGRRLIHRENAGGPLGGTQ